MPYRLLTTALWVKKNNKDGSVVQTIYRFVDSRFFTHTVFLVSPHRVFLACTSQVRGDAEKEELTLRSLLGQTCSVLMRPIHPSTGQQQQQQRQQQQRQQQQTTTTRTREGLLFRFHQVQIYIIKVGRLLEGKRG